jgi:uroporphyrinogen-III synthase
MPDAPLSGRVIAITRPIEQSQTLAELIREQGGTPLLFPLLEIAPLQNYQDFDDLLSQYIHVDWAIFISSNAVQQGMPRVRHRFSDLPAQLRFAAIGPGTAFALQKYGIGHVLIPREHYDSEHLLALPEMNRVAGQRITIFRGVGGRELLAETLSKRGAKVQFAECYRRLNPQQDAGDLPRLWQNEQLHALVVTSSEALQNLLDLARDAEWLRNTLLCVNHARIAELAQHNGLQVALSATPGDEGMLNCLIKHTRQAS